MLDGWGMVVVEVEVRLVGTLVSCHFIELVFQIGYWIGASIADVLDWELTAWFQG